MYILDDLNCIVCGTRRRGVFVWDLNNSKIIKRFKEVSHY